VTSQDRDGWWLVASLVNCLSSTAERKAVQIKSVTVIVYGLRLNEISSLACVHIFDNVMTCHIS